MRVEEVITRNYIANDGTAFKNEAECREYEEDRITEVLESYSKGCFEDLPPINYCSEDYGTEYNSKYYWFEVNDRIKLYEITSAFGLQIEAQNISVPTFICIRQDFNFNKFVLYGLDEIKANAKTYFKWFGLDVEFNEVKEK